MSGLRVVPCTITDAKAFIREHHRHHRPPLSGLFAAAVADGERVVGVAIVGRPVARALQDGQTAEVTRVATDGTRNACSLLYGACWRAARALGWKRLITYTLPSEGGASLRGAGWTLIGETGGGTWYTPSRPRVDKHPTQRKLRWERAAALLAIAVVLAACGGSSSRPSTPPVPAVVIQTEAGALAVVAYGCDPDLPRMVREVNTTTRVARKKRPGLFAGAPLTGFEIHARTPQASAQRCDGNPACFERFGNRGRLHVWCDGGGLEHESAHALAHAAGLPCWAVVLHDGTDFTCRRKVPHAAR